ncbi:MAG: ribose-phosphate diphosphokinase [Candidatus Caldarchaeum sp.]
MKVVSGVSSADLAAKLSRFLNAPVVNVESKRFPDGESYVRVVGAVAGEEVVLVQGLHPPQDTHLTQLLLLADCLNDLGASSIRAVVPYMAYARQDRRFRDGEAVSILTVLKLLKTVGVSELITVNIHSPWILEKSAVPVRNVDATGLLASYLLQAGVEKPLVLSPGKKGLEMAASVASVMETDYAHVESRRNLEDGRVSVSVDADLGGREVVLVDDVISTGETMAKCVELARRKGAARVVVAAVHGLFVGSSVEKITSAGADLVMTTDTVPNPYAVASVAGLVAAQLE